MKVTLYIDTTANGMIAKPDGNSDFTSKADTKSFNATCQKIGTVIMGRKTYDVLSASSLPLKKGLHVVLTKNPNYSSGNPTVRFTSKPPQEILQDLEKEGITEVCLIGGSQTISQFMSDNLIDEIYQDIEPVLFGEGLPLFFSRNLEVKLELLEVRHLSSQTIQLHWQVLKTP